MDGPNVLVLDEPTNDFDVETLTALEDLLDSFGGTLIVVSHDRYFLERVTDQVYALLGDGKIRHLPRGIDEYLEIRQASDQVSLVNSGSVGASVQPSTNSPTSNEPLSSGELRAVKKQLSKLERAIATADKEEAALHTQLAEHASDFEKCVELNAALADVIARKNDAETQWMVVAEQLEGS